MANIRADNVLPELIGPAAFARLCERYGGGDLQLPRSLDAPSARTLVDVLGEAGARALIDWGGGSRFYVPHGYRDRPEFRAAVVRELYAAGMTMPEIARSYRYSGRYTERQVTQILAMTEP